MNRSEQRRSRIRIICKYAFVDRPLEAIPLKLPRQFKKFDIYASLVSSGFVFQENDVLVISSKYVSISEGSIISLDTVRVSSKAAALAKKFHIQEQLAEIGTKRIRLCLERDAWIPANLQEWSPSPKCRDR